jgi:LuxR family transcriptional regulator, maltose regulon positive regulatory protein
MPPSVMADRPVILALRHIVPTPPADPATMPAPPVVAIARAGASNRRVRSGVVGSQYVSRAVHELSVSGPLSRLGPLLRSGDRPHARGASGRPVRISDLASVVLFRAAVAHIVRGEFDQAIGQLREAYEFTPVSERASMAHDVAGKLALAYSMRGDATEAAEWLDRQAAAPGQLGMVASLVDSAGLIAQALLADGALDAQKCSATLDALAPGPFNDELWAMLVHAHTMFALGWGDRPGLLDQIGQARAGHPNLAETQRNDGISAPLLTAAEANLLLSLGRGNQAWAVLNYGAEQHPPTAPDRPIAIDLALIRAVALHRLRRPNEAIAALIDAIALASDDQLYAFTAVPRAELTDLNSLLPASAQLSPETLDRLPDVYPARVALLLLTQQEQLVLNALADDKTMAKLAAEQHLSESTITTHRRHLYRKLGVNSRETALAAAAELGLLDWTN